MTLNDWRHVIEEYTPMIRANAKDVVPEEQAKTISMNYPIAAEE
jgi:hypothetical protein